MSYELNIPIKRYWDHTPHPDEPNREHCHVIRATEQKFIVDFLSRRIEGALLISGMRGVGKTSMIFSAIQDAMAKSSDSKMIVSLVNAPYFEMGQSDKTNSGSDFKREVLQNLIKRLYLSVNNKYNSSNNAIIDKKRDRIFHRFRFLLLKEKPMHPDNDLKDIHDRITALYEKSIAKEVRHEFDVYELDREKKSTERMIKTEFNLTQLLLITIGFTILGFTFLFLPINPIPDPIKSTLSMLIVAIPAILKSSLTFRKVHNKEKENSRERTIYYRYDYDINTQQSELEEILRELYNTGYRPVFIIDELDKVKPESAVETIQSLKTLINNTSTVFIFITDDSFLNNLNIDSKIRNKNYTLFTHKIFVGRAKFEEIRKYMDFIMEETLVNPCIHNILEWDQVKLNEPQRLGNFMNSSQIEDHLKGITDVMITKDHNNSLMLRFNDQLTEIRHDTMYEDVILKDANREYEFQTISKNNKKYLYTRSQQYRSFQDYACFMAKSDFYDLYDVLRDHIRYESDSISIEITMDEEKELVALLQRILENVYKRKKFSRQSEWYKNDRLLILMYDIIYKIHQNKNLRLLKIRKTPFEITFPDPVHQAREG